MKPIGYLGRAIAALVGRWFHSCDDSNVIEPPQPLHVSGIELAARFVENRRDDYVREHGSFDPYTGATEFPGNGDEYVFELEEIIAGIRALARSEATGP